MNYRELMRSISGPELPGPVVIPSAGDELAYRLENGRFVLRGRPVDGGSQPSALYTVTRLIDLATLAAGPLIDLWTPSGPGGFAVVTFAGPGEYVQSDADWDVLFGQNIVPTGGTRRWSHRYAPNLQAVNDVVDQFVRGTTSHTTYNGSNIAMLDGYLPTADPFQCGFISDFDGWIDRAVLPAWPGAAQPVTLDTLVIGGDGNYYQAQDDGTTGGSEPTWPGNGLTVTDNDFDWLGVGGPPPTTGTIRVVLLVADPA